MPAEEVLSGAGERLAQHAAAQARKPALIFVPEQGPPETLSWAQLEQQTNRLARLLADHGADASQLLVMALGNTPAFVELLCAAWKLGISVLPLSPNAPAAERDALIATAREFRPPFTVGAWKAGAPPDLPASALAQTGTYDASPLAPALAAPGTVVGSGGTSGRPKLTVDESPAAIPVRDGRPVVPPVVAALGIRAGQRRLICTPLYHTNAVSMLSLALLLGDTVVLCETFNADTVLETIASRRVQQMLVVPAVLQRLTTAIENRERDLSSLESVGCGGSHCPDWLLRRWIELVGAEHVYYGYGATEGHGKAMIRGDEWLDHAGSVGRPRGSDVKIVGESGEELPPGEVGEIYMRPHGVTAPAFRYVGADYSGVTADGFASVGDFGWVDADGYLYIADRRTDMIVSGGANVYPAEVEDVLSRHPGVADVAVIGLRDEQWGRRVHAVIEPRDATVEPAALDAHCRDHLAPAKCPKSYEFIEQLPRTDVGKVSRSRLVAEREPGDGASQARD